MNAFNRLVLVGLLLAVALTAISVAVLSWTIPEDSINVLDEAVDWLEESYGNPEKVLATTGSLLIALIAIVFIMMELSPTSGREVKVTDLQGGEAYLSTASIGQRIEEAVTRVPSITDVKAEVYPKQKGVTVTLDLHVDPQANVATVTDDACRATRDVLANQVHVALVEPPLAHLHYREPVATRGGARRPAAVYGSLDSQPAGAAAPLINGHSNGHPLVSNTPAPETPLLTDTKPAEASAPDRAAAVEPAYDFTPPPLTTTNADEEPSSAEQAQGGEPTTQEAAMVIDTMADEPVLAGSGSPSIDQPFRRVNGPAGEYAVDEYGRVINLPTTGSETEAEPGRRESV